MSETSNEFGQLETEISAKFQRLLGDGFSKLDEDRRKDVVDSVSAISAYVRESTLAEQVAERVKRELSAEVGEQAAKRTLFAYDDPWWWCNTVSNAVAVVSVVVAGISVVSYLSKKRVSSAPTAEEPIDPFKPYQAAPRPGKAKSSDSAVLH